MQPLHILVFLAPLLIAYEVGSWMYLRDASTGTQQSVAAYKMIESVMTDLGAIGAALPTLLTVATLLVWHVTRRDSWRIRPGVLLGLFVESICWTLPLIVLASFVGSIELLQATGFQSADRSWQANLTLAVGAGIYEELLFRLFIVGLGTYVLVRAGNLRSPEAGWVAVAVSAVLFALYHRPFEPGGGIDVVATAVYLAAGVYFGTLYLSRGLGVVVAVHALYDIAVLLLLPLAR